MRTTRKSEEKLEERLLLNTVELQEKLGCGRYSAVKIGVDACARIVIGRRIFWNPKKIESYLDRVAQ